MNHGKHSDGPANVLVVDDDHEAADLHATFLEPRYQVTAAYGGEEALERLRDDTDVVLLDRRMPGMNGDELLREIRASDIDCRVVMVTAVEPGIDLVSLEFDDYLVKPVSKEALHDAVERMLARDALDENLLDVFSLASKMATLESKMDPGKLEASSEYAELEARFAEYQQLFDRIDPTESLYAELSAVKMNAMFARG